MEKVTAMPIDPTPIARPKNAEPWRQINLSGIVTLVLASSVPIATGLFAMVLGLRFELALLFVFLPVQLVLGVIAGRRFSGKRGQSDAILQILVVFFAMTVVVLLVSVVWSVIERGSAALSWQFITQNNVYISGQTSLEYGGLGHAIIGTLLIVLLSTIVTVPLGIATAVYLTETTGKTRSTVRTLIQALSGLPSVVAGLFILSSLVDPVTKELSGLMGSLALTILMIPTIARTAEEMLRLIPNELREAGVALGGTQWRTVAGVVLPAAKSGLVTAIILGVARIIGETAPILLVSGGGDSLNLNPTEGAMGSLPFYIWKAFLTSGTPESLARAWAGMLVLLSFIFILFGMARYISGRKVG